MSSNNLVLNRLFTQNVFKDLLNYGENSVYATVIKRYTHDADSKDNGTLISEIYKVLSKSYRNEYFYMNTLLNKLLLGKHRVNTTTVLTQIPIGSSKADFILINGKAIVYEIKTELDSFERLDNQIADYFKAFNRVCVVTSENNFSKIIKLLQDTPVGVYTLTRKNTLSTTMCKEPSSNTNFLEHSAIFKILHKQEFENIIRLFYEELPKTTQVFYYKECLAWFSKIPIHCAYLMSLEQLKNRNKIVQEDFQQVPYELKALMYFSKNHVLRYSDLEIFLNKRYGG